MKTKGIRSEWVAASRSASTPKLIVVLHGRGDSPEGFRWLPGTLGFPEVNYLLVQAPDRYFTGYSWYDLPPHQGPGILRSRASLDALFDEISAQGFRTEDTVLFGFSQGCLMTLEWGGRTRRRFAGFVALSGYCYDPVKLAAEMSAEAKEGRWLVTHGTADDVLDYAVTQSQVEFLIGAGLPLEFHSFSKTHTIDDTKEIPLLRRWIGERLAVPTRTPVDR